MHLYALLLVFGTTIGIALGYLSPSASEILIASLALLILQSLVYFFERKGNQMIAFSFCTMLVACGISAGILRVQFVEEKTPIVCAPSCTIEGVITQTPERGDMYQTFVLATREGGVYRVQVRAPLYPELRVGETIQATGKVTLPPKLYPHDGEKSFDYAAYLSARDVGSVMMFPAIEVIDTEAHTLGALLGRWKEDLVSRMGMYVGSPEVSLGSGMLFGDSSMSKETEEMFRIAGLSHIVVLSGFNIAIVIGFVLFVFTFLPLLLRIFLASLFTILFVVMVGGEASVIRATLMAFVSLLALAIGREHVARQALLVSFLLIIMYQPEHLLYDASLHLSFLATAGIVYLSELIAHVVAKLPKLIRELFVTTCAAYLATLPYVSYTFGTVSLYALIANLFALPFVPIGMLLSFLTVVVSFISAIIALPIGYVTTLVLSLILYVGEIIASLPYASVAFSLSLPGMIFFYVTLWIIYRVWLVRSNNETKQTYTKEGYMTDVIAY